ncbi:MAG: hypothetical protein ACOC80_13700, partial [Petrotogales bacterium]
MLIKGGKILQEDVSLEEGQLVYIRRRPALIRDVKSFVDDTTQNSEHLVNIEYIDGWSFPSEDNVIWEREVGTRVLSKAVLPDVGSPTSKPDVPSRFEAFLDAIRWSTKGRIPDIVGLPEEYTYHSVISPWQSAVQVEDYQLYP